MNTYSFSRLTSWWNCKEAWKRSYIDLDKGEDNWFSRFGTLAHDIFEKVDLGKILPQDAHVEWSSRYSAEVLLGKDSHEVYWMDNWKADADRFFKGFSGWRTKAIWIEKHVLVEDSYVDADGNNVPFKFQGFVDRMSQLTNGAYSVQDYKCSKPYEGKNLSEKVRQMYLYARPVKEEFGEFPSKLIFFHFRQNAPVVVPFKMEAYEEAWQWVRDTVAEMETYEGDFPLTDRGYFCKAICNYRNSCPNGNQ